MLIFNQGKASATDAALAAKQSVCAGGDDMTVGKELPRRDRRKIRRWIEAIDECLQRYLNDLPNCELTLAEFLKLAELEETVADEGEERTVVRWVTKSSREDESER